MSNRAYITALSHRFAATWPVRSRRRIQPAIRREITRSIIESKGTSAVLKIWEATIKERESRSRKHSSKPPQPPVDGGSK